MIIKWKGELLHCVVSEFNDDVLECFNSNDERKLNLIIDEDNFIDEDGNIFTQEQIECEDCGMLEYTVYAGESIIESSQDLQSLKTKAQTVKHMFPSLNIHIWDSHNNLIDID